MIPESVTQLKDLHFRLVSKCNLSCKHCYASDWFIRTDQLNTSQVCEAIDQAIDLGLEKVTFTGGEPTLHKDISFFIQYCAEKSLPVKMETNGLLLRKNNNHIINLIVNNKDLAYLYISYDLATQRGIKHEEHDFIRHTIIDLHNQGVNVRLQTTLTEINVQDLETLIELPREYGIHQRIFLGHSITGNGVSLIPFDLDFVLQMYNYLKSLNLNIALELPPLISGQVQKNCGWGLYRCEIMPNGDVTTCGPITYTQTNFIAGNIKDKSLKQIWLESDYFAYTRRIKQTDFQGICGRCLYWGDCRGSCRSVSWSRGKDWFSPYPLCHIYAKRYPEKVKDQLIHISKRTCLGNVGLQYLGILVSSCSILTSLI